MEPAPTPRGADALAAWLGEQVAAAVAEERRAVEAYEAARARRKDLERQLRRRERAWA